MDPAPEKIENELARRHKSAVTTVVSLAIATVLLSVVAYLGREYLTPRSNPPLEMAVTISILFLGIGSIVWRRTKFAAMRLQDIGALHGAAGLLATLEKTTIQLSIIGAAIVVIGFATTLVTGNEGYTFRAAAISLVVLAYSFPTKSSWNRVIRAFAEPQPVPKPAE